MANTGPRHKEGQEDNGAIQGWKKDDQCAVLTSLPRHPVIHPRVTRMVLRNNDLAWAVMVKLKICWILINIKTLRDIHNHSSLQPSHASRWPMYGRAQACCWIWASWSWRDLIYLCIFRRVMSQSNLFLLKVFKALRYNGSFLLGPPSVYFHCWSRRFHIPHKIPHLKGNLSFSLHHHQT